MFGEIAVVVWKVIEHVILHALYERVLKPCFPYGLSFLLIFSLYETGPDAKSQLYAEALSSSAVTEQPTSTPETPVERSLLPKSGEQCRCQQRQTEKSQKEAFAWASTPILRLSKPQAKKLKKRARELGIPPEELLRRILDDKFEQELHASFGKLPASH